MDMATSCTLIKRVTLNAAVAKIDWLASVNRDHESLGCGDLVLT